MHIETRDIDFVIAVARGAGDLVRRMYASGQATVREKSSEIDLVTAADVAAEGFIRSALDRLYPGVALWGEESNQPPTQALYWLVDPIDGTTNFAHNVAYCSVNIALQDGPTTLLAVTYHIGLDCTYYAQAGGGAYLRTARGEERRLQVSATASLRKSLLITGFPYHRAEAMDNNAAEFAYFMPRTACVRNLGSAALDLAHVAQGAADGYWEGWLNPWDIAAGALLVREAGGRVTTYAGRDWSVRDNHIVASNGVAALHNALLEGIHTARAALTELRLDIYG
ncbi:MAG TPA: inositol monophosphatase [Chloroflexi bacterium]|nr:inositol monophosphatase [Chloroflexota bacterium]